MGRPAGGFVQLPKGLSISTASEKKRVLRRPTHNHHLRHRPFQIQPFMIAPVLPGETLKNLVMQARVVTDPIKNSLIGWWMEYYYFFVPIRALDDDIGTPTDRTRMENMLLDLNAPLADSTSPGVHYYHGGGNDAGFDFVGACVNRIVSEYFRDEGESVSGTHFDFGSGPPIAQIQGKSFLDSMYVDAEMPADITVDVDATPTPDNFSIAELDGLYQTWQILRQQHMTEMTFEDYQASFGVRTPKATSREAKPELIRFVREWSYPSNTVNPADILDGSDEVVTPAGTPSSAVSWSISERADKDRFFREPGFIIGVTIARPKLYLSNQRANASVMLQNTMTWLPAVLKESVESSLRHYAQGTGPLNETEFAASGYWVDVRDLFVHGDQFVNFALDATDAGLVALPVVEGNSASRYPATADVNALFVDGTNANLVRQDGVTNLSILGTQMDTT